MIRWLLTIIASVLLIPTSSCSFNQTIENETSGGEASNYKPPVSGAVVDPSAPSEASTPAKSNILVVYFSATGNTEQIAELIVEETGADLYQITPETPYTSADLNYGDSSSRANKQEKGIVIQG